MMHVECWDGMLLCALSSLAISVESTASAKPVATPVKPIYAADMSGDCDDAGALAAIHALADSPVVMRHRRIED